MQPYDSNSTRAKEASPVARLLLASTATSATTPAIHAIADRLLRVAYAGGVVFIPKGKKFYIQNDMVAVGWHGTYDPPVDMAGGPLLPCKKT